MLFNANEFILAFLPITFLLFHLVRRFSIGSAVGVLALMSLVFYGHGEPRFIALLLVSVVFNYFVGCSLIEKKNAALLFVAIVVDVVMIGYFKYANFFIENVNGVLSQSFEMRDIVLPLGISFYTFQKIAFLVDAYKSKVSKPTFVEYLLFISFFPQLIAGPIVHYNQVSAQIRSRDPIPLGMITAGLFLYCLGLFKKTVFADFFGVWADVGFNGIESLSSSVALISTLAYTFQIYFDFSGYSDMAVGLGMLFGIVLPINFNSPYKSKSIVEFWKRWHITLSQWLRDYIYIPLGGRGDSWGIRFFNVMVTMLVGGLWHGAGWTFVIWGGLHGLIISVNHLWLRWKPSVLESGPAVLSKSYAFIAWLSTLCMVSFLWILFRADSLADAGRVISSLGQFSWAVVAGQAWPDLSDYFGQATLTFPAWLLSVEAYFLFNLSVVALFVLIVALLPNAMAIHERFKSSAVSACFCAATVFIVVVSNVFLVTPNAFIYFRF